MADHCSRGYPVCFSAGCLALLPPAIRIRREEQNVIAKIRGRPSELQSTTGGFLPGRNRMVAEKPRRHGVRGQFAGLCPLR
jgi:hypothetical protein